MKENELRGKMELYILYEVNGWRFDRSINNEEQMKKFIEDIVEFQKECLDKNGDFDFKVIEVVNNLGY